MVFFIVFLQERTLLKNLVIAGEMTRAPQYNFAIPMILGGSAEISKVSLS